MSTHKATLTLVKGPGGALGERRQVPLPGMHIGRDAECDWTLLDPQRTLSRTHCCLECADSGWRVRDLSANGTFVNGDPDPIGKGRTRNLCDGDRLRIGDYELVLELRPVAPQISPFDAQPVASLFGEVGHGLGFAGVSLPGLDVPLPPVGTAWKPPPAVADHSPATGYAFKPPAVMAAPPARAARDDSSQVAPKHGVPPTDWFPKVERAQEAIAPPLPGPPVASPPVAPFGANARLGELPPPAVAPVPTGSAALPADGSSLQAVALLMEAAGLPPDTLHRAAADPDEALRRAGVMLLAAVSGLRSLLVARGLVKREFRIEQTMLRPKDNNPLKFAASDELALASLLDPRMKGLQAVEQAIGDLTEHEVAVLRATQAAARAMLESLSPALLVHEDSGGGLLPGATEKRLWQAYQRRHAKLLAQLEDDFESAFGTAFARAYEQAVNGTASRS
jgi:type VI secretion system FHA domain protein